MIAPPPRVVRRLVVDPIVVVLCLVLLILTPAVACLVAAPAAALRRSLQPLTLVWLVGVFAAREVVGVVGLTALWLAAGCGRQVHMPRWQEAHYRLMGWWIDGPWGVATAGLGLRVQIDRPALPETPLVVLARHAGMGDSLVLVRTLLELGRRPRLVIQAALEWDPCIDLIGHRVPTVFVPVQRERRQRAVPSVERLALDMHDNDALVIFPEGGNSTRRRREAVVRRLHAKGRHRLADRAASLRHLLPPQPTGTLAILRAAPEATVVVAAHAGLDQVEDVTSLIDNVPLRAPVRLAWRLVRPDELPDSDASREEWLMDQWQDMDATITALDAGADARTTPLLRQRADEVG